MTPLSAPRRRSIPSSNRPTVTPSVRIRRAEHCLEAKKVGFALPHAVYGLHSGARLRAAARTLDGLRPSMIRRVRCRTCPGRERRTWACDFESVAVRAPWRHSGRADQRSDPTAEHTGKGEGVRRTLHSACHRLRHPEPGHLCSGPRELPGCVRSICLDWRSYVPRSIDSL